MSLCRSASVALVLFAIVALSCAASGNGGPGPQDAGSGVTFTQIYLNILSTKCVPCHTDEISDGITEGKLNMTSQAMAYKNLVGVTASGVECSGKGIRVVAGNADQSLLYSKAGNLGPAPCGVKMPVGGPPLSDDDTAAIKGWINDGAPNN